MDHSRLSVNFGYDSENPDSHRSLWRTAVSAGPSVNRPFLHKPWVLQIPLSSKATWVRVFIPCHPLPHICHTARRLGHSLRSALRYFVLYDKTFPRRDTHTHPLSPDRDPTTEKIIGTTKAWGGEPTYFIGVPRRSRNDWEHVSPKPSLAGVTDHKVGNLEQTVQLQVGDCPFQMTDSGLNLIQAAGWFLLLGVFVAWLICLWLSEIFTAPSGRKRPSERGQF